MSVAYEEKASEALKHLGLDVALGQLDQAAQAAAAGSWSYTHFLGYLLEGELRFRHEKTVRLSLQFARLPYQKRIDDFDFKAQPSVDQRLVRELATGRYIAQAENVLVFGPPGVGKTHLAIALGRAAVETAHSVLFVSATTLLAALAKGESEGQLKDKLNFFAKPL